jgi:hypothetical protein
MARKKIANYNSNPNYLDYLTALRKFFTNDVDIIPIIQEFNFYVNGVYAIPYTDLFRAYEENGDDIHGTEKMKQFIDDGTIGIIQNQVYQIGLISSLENLRVYMLDRSKKYTITYNPFINAYAEALIPKINNLGTVNPVVTSNGIDLANDEIKDLPALPMIDKKVANDEVQNPQQPRIIGGTKASLPPKKKTKIVRKNPIKILFSKLNFLLNKKKK